MNINTVKIHLMKTIITSMLVLFASTSIAAERYELRIQNPKKQIGYVVGDTFTRTLMLDVKAPYKLSPASIPAKGLSSKGIELSAVKVSEKQSSKATHYQIQLNYQIFTSSATVKKLEIAKHPLKITYAGKFIIVKVPAWPFRVSPLAVNGEVYIEHDMSPYRGPMLVESGKAKLLLGAFFSMVIVALIGLIYINADLAWFPGMGGPFAMSYRELAGLTHLNESVSPNDSALIQQAATSVHRAFNKTYGENVFATNIDEFLERHPKFASIKQEIHDFFSASHHVLFAVSSGSKNTTSIAMLIKFCEQCRHCERSVA